MSVVGRVFANRYEITREIARGGMAHVYLARDRSLDRDVAIKVLFAEYAREPSFVERFRREAQAAANLNRHPNIVSIYDFGQEQGTYFIVMEYIDGDSARELIQREVRVDPQRAAALVAEVASALSFAHKSGVIHRDVKPANILLTAEGTPKVADFGIARAGTADGLTQTGSVMGTATYFSPEQAQGQDVDGRSDVYALGIVLYELVTGGPPFTGDSPISVAYQHVREPVPKPSSRAAVPAPLEHIIMKALAKNPAHRYQSADDLRADLLRYRRGREPSAAPVTAIVADARAEQAYRDQAGATVAQPRVNGGRTGPPTNQLPVADVTGPPNRTGRALAGAIIFTALALAIAAILLVPRVIGNEDPRTVRVPNLVGLNEEEAIRVLDLAELEHETRTKQRDDVPEGQVIDQKPRADAEVDANSTVTLTISSAKPDIAIPAVVGLTRGQAEAKLVEAGFVIENIRAEFQFDDDVAANTVLSTNPPGGTFQAESAVITLVISQGQELVTVPNIVGQTQEEAANTLDGARLSIRFQEVASEGAEIGTITSTDPPAGARVGRNSVVTAFVSSGPAQGNLPRVVGLDRDAAEAALSAAGFADVVVILVPTVNEEDVGKVLTQDPAGNETVNQSTRVVLTVGELATIPTLPTTTSTTTTTSSTTAPTTTTTT